MTQLKLGPLPKVETVRVSVTMETLLKDALDLYARKRRDQANLPLRNGVTTPSRESAS